MGHEKRGDITVRSIYQAVLRHRRKASFVFLSVMAAVTAATLLFPKTYRSEGKLFVRLGRENAALDPTTTLGQAPPVIIPQFRDDEINSVIEILRSRWLLEKVVDGLGPQVVLGRDHGKVHKNIALKKQSLGTLGLSDDSAVVRTTAGWIQQLNPNWRLTDRDLAIHKLSTLLKINSPRKSNVIVVTCDTNSPELSQAIVAKMIGVYLSEHSRLNRPTGAHEFLVQQTAGMRERLVKSEMDLKELKNETGLAAVDVQRGLLVTRLSKLEDEADHTDQELAAAEAEVRELVAKLQTMPKTTTQSLTTGAENQASDLMHSRLYDLQVREQELRSMYTDNHPEVIAVRQQSAASAKIFEKEPRARQVETVGPSRPAEEAEVELVRQEPKLASLRARSQVLRDQLKTVRSELKTFNENSQRIVELQREAELQDTNYRRYAQNLEDAHIDQALESEQISNINVVEPATLNIRPVWPKAWLNLGLGFIVALVSSVGVAVVADSRNRSGQSADAAETT